MAIAELRRTPEITRQQKVYTDLPSRQLQRISLDRQESLELATGVIDINTRPYTGRSPEDTFVPEGNDEVNYGSVNQRISREVFESLYERGLYELSKRNSEFVQQRSIGASSDFNIPVTLRTESPAAAQFANIMFYPRMENPPSNPFAEYTILHVPSVKLNGAEDGVRSEVAVIRDFQTRRILIQGSRYLGEIKKSMFCVANFELPRQGIASMHCSSNKGPGGETALFFGLSGTGKTTLSMDNYNGRSLIGDDEHGWSDEGIFTFEPGSYAKLINLSAKKEPLVYAASRQRGGISENVTVDLYLNPLYDQGEENMRHAFPTRYIKGSSPDGVGGHPQQIIFLTADASGVLPPVAQLTPEEAIYHYLSGYTSKIPGTERGVTEPQPTFSAGFGGAFLTLPPVRYAELLAEKIATHTPTLWLVNTGWPGGYKEDGRMDIDDTRTIVRAILSGEVHGSAKDGMNLTVPLHIEGVDPKKLRAENYWQDQEAYIKSARELTGAFQANIKRFEGKVPHPIYNAGPQFIG